MIGREKGQLEDERQTEKEKVMIGIVMEKHRHTVISEKDTQT